MLLFTCMWSTSLSEWRAHGICLSPSGLFHFTQVYLLPHVTQLKSFFLAKQDSNVFMYHVFLSIHPSMGILVTVNSAAINTGLWLSLIYNHPISFDIMFFFQSWKPTFYLSNISVMGSPQTFLLYKTDEVIFHNQNMLIQSQVIPSRNIFYWP